MINSFTETLFWNLSCSYFRRIDVSWQVNAKNLNTIALPLWFPRPQHSPRLPRIGPHIQLLHLHSAVEVICDLANLFEIGSDLGQKFCIRALSCAVMFCWFASFVWRLIAQKKIQCWHLELKPQKINSYLSSKANVEVIFVTIRSYQNHMLA